MGDLRQVAYAESQKLTAKRQAESAAPSAPPLFARLSQAGIPVHAATILGSEIGVLLERIKTLEARLEFLEHHSG